MYLARGIPLLSDVEKLMASEHFRAHVQFNQSFIQTHGPAMAEYGRRWALDQLRLWSRRWEYPFVAQRLISFAEQHPGGCLKILDAGSGVTYFPYFIVDRLPQAEFTCCDYDPTYEDQFEQINRQRNEQRVRFLQADLRRIPLPDASIDAVCCISVLEHTDNYPQILKEFARVLKPGGLFVLTFDLSLDGKFPLSKSQAAEMLRILRESFNTQDGFDPVMALDRMRQDGILTTDSVRHTQPDLLPWSKTARAYKAVQDVIAGRGWTGGFRSLSVYCIDVTKKHS
jgi:SAM-dependent methyltransferase